MIIIVATKKKPSNAFDPDNLPPIDHMPIPPITCPECPKPKEKECPKCPSPLECHRTNRFESFDTYNREQCMVGDERQTASVEKSVSLQSCHDICYDKGVTCKAFSFDEKDSSCTLIMNPEGINVEPLLKQNSTSACFVRSQHSHPKEMPTSTSLPVSKVVEQEETESPEEKLVEAPVQEKVAQEQQTATIPTSTIPQARLFKNGDTTLKNTSDSNMTAVIGGQINQENDSITFMLNFGTGYENFVGIRAGYADNPQIGDQVHDTGANFRSTIVYNKSDTYDGYFLGDPYGEDDYYLIKAVVKDSQMKFIFYKKSRDFTNKAIG